MSAATKLRMVAPAPLTPLESAAKAVGVATIELEIAVKSLDEDRADESAMLSRYDLDDAENVASGVAKARLHRERGERHHAARAADLEVAQRALVEAQRVADRLEMEANITVVAGLAVRLAPHLDSIVNLDRQAGVVVDEIADLVLVAIDAFDRATAIADKLECPHVVQRQVTRPTMSWCALIARIAVARDRASTRRDLANGWLQSEPEPAWDDPARPAYDAALAALEASCPAK